jgi:hypothetical protein
LREFGGGRGRGGGEGGRSGEGVGHGELRRIQKLAKKYSSGS